jgi:cytochrome b6
LEINSSNKQFSDKLPISFSTLFKNRTVPVHKYSFTYYFGGLTLMFLIVQVITGLLLTLYYKPSPDDAYASVLYITDKVQFGSMVRSMHYWAANGLIASMLIHLFTSLFLSAYRKPRGLVWVSGCIIFLSAFTGHILPWDELSYSSAQIGLAEIERFPILGEFLSSVLRGSREITSATLSRMSAMHTAVLPVLLISIAGFHLFLNFILGFSKPLGIKTDNEMKLYPDFKYRSAIVWLTGFAVVLTLAVLIPHQSGKPFDINTLSEAPSAVKPAWYFMFLYQSTKLDAFIPGSLLLLIALSVYIIFTAIPYLDKKSNAGIKNKTITLTGILILLYIAVMTITGYLNIF